MEFTRSHSWEATATFVLQILSPALILSCYVLTSIIALLKSDVTSTIEDRPSRFPKRVAIALNVGVTLLFLGESIVLAYEDPLWALLTNPNLVYALFSNLIWIIMLVGLVDTKPGAIASRFSGPWTTSLFLEVALFVLSMAKSNLPRNAQIARSVLQMLRLALTGSLLCLAAGSKVLSSGEKGGDEEVAPLLIASVHDYESLEEPTITGTDYGTAGPNGHIDTSAKKSSDDTRGDGKAADSKKESSEEDEDEDEQHFNKMTKNWWVYVKAFAFFLPYLWPKTLRLQLHFPALACTILAERALNVAIPVTLGKLVTSLGGAERTTHTPWIMISLYVLYRLLGSQSGLSLLRNLLWQPVEKNAHIQLSVAGYNHVMNMSCDFHDSKASARLWQTLHRGLSITQLFEILSFELLPMAADLLLAISVFWWLFDSYMAFLVACVVLLFLWSTKKGIALKTAKRRVFIKAWEDEYRQLAESSQNWTTVSYFNRIKYEIGRHAAAVTHTQTTTIAYQMIGYSVSAIRSLTLLSGLFAGSCLAMYQIIYGRRQVGDFVVFLTYWQQLSGPLNFFAHGFSLVAENLVNAEKFLVLMQKIPTVRDHEDANQFVLTKGEVDFQNVTFSYDGKRQVTNDVTLHVKAGQTIALVGETGGGKSTILKLLFRFYDVTGGQVMIDGQDIRDVTLESLRENIGVVPQDPSLFNQTILDNLRYAKLDATNEEIHSACKAVALHEKIMTFTKGYDTKVGERGVKMSGGELQRMAIARAMLMDPKILLLDEATSSVDSETESQIQASLKTLCAGRTTFVIAHRLSTIVDADVVVVINNGQIVEQGSHADLLKTEGHYHKLWARQLKQQKGDDRSKSRSRSPAKKEAPLLLNDVSSGDDNAVLLKQAIAEPHHHRNGSEVRQTHQESTHATGQESEEVHSPIGGQMRKRRGRSPAKAAVGSLTGRVSGHLQEEPKSPPALTAKSALRGLNVDAPEFVPTTLQSNGISTPINDDKVHEESENPKSFSTSALAAIPEEKSKELWSRRNSSPVKLEPETRGAATELTNGNTIPADRVPPRRMCLLSPRRENTQSEPFAETDFKQVDGAEENEVVSGGGSTSMDGGAGKRTVSAPLGTTGGQEAMATDGSQGHSRTISNDSNAETDEGLASPRIKAPANTPARAISEETSPKTKV
jgi:ABC-type transport system involved in Fe-S cluster assembly fused permease/ATPase subunit